MKRSEPLRATFPAWAVHGPDVTEDDPGAAAVTEARWTALREALARAVRRQCPRWLSDHAEDLAQSALVKVMAMPGTGEGNRPLSSFYLYRVAHSALVDEIRRRQRRREVALEVDESEERRGGTVEPQAAGDPEQDASHRELGAGGQRLPARDDQ